MWGSSLINLLEHMHDLSMLISEHSISNRGTQWVVAIPIYILYIMFTEHILQTLFALDPLAKQSEVLHEVVALYQQCWTYNKHILNWR